MLGPQVGDADGLSGRIIFPVVAGFPGELREDLNDESFVARDLNSDNVQDALDHSGDYDLLPVRVRIEWRAKSGNRFIERIPFKLR